MSVSLISVKLDCSIILEILSLSLAKESILLLILLISESLCLRITTGRADRFSVYALRRLNNGLLVAPISTNWVVMCIKIKQLIKHTCLVAHFH